MTCPDIAKLCPSVTPNSQVSLTTVQFPPLIKRSKTIKWSESIKEITILSSNNSISNCEVVFAPIMSVALEVPLSYSTNCNIVEPFETATCTNIRTSSSDIMDSKSSPIVVLRIEVSFHVPSKVAIRTIWSSSSTYTM